MRPVSILHTVASLHARHGGPSRSVTSLCDALASQGAAVHLLAGRDGEESECVAAQNARVKQASHSRSPASAYAVRQHLVRGVDATRQIIHDHGLWLPVNITSALAAKRTGVPYIVSTRGMLEPRAVLHRGGRKRIAWRLYQRRILERAALLHATADSELESIRQLGLRGPVAVIPNGVSLPPTSRNDVPTEQRTVLFLSRVHPIKGLSMLLDAWSIVGDERWKLVIAGPNEGGHQKDLMQRAKRLGLNDAVAFHGEVSDAEKWELYASADLFILPTHSENFGIVVAEAMAAGLPVITTKGAPWSVLSELDCGWWTDISTDAIASALKEATSMPPERLSEMGGRGARYVQENLSWETVAEQMLEVYEWVLSGGTPPSSLHLS